MSPFSLQLSTRLSDYVKGIEQQIPLEKRGGRPQYVSHGQFNKIQDMQMRARTGLKVGEI